MAGRERVGFIGVGYMGHGMAANILAKGYPLTVMANRNRVPVEDLVGRGAREARTPKDVAAQSDIVFLCVTGSPQVEGLVRGKDGFLDAAHESREGLPLIIADCSTADPASTLALAGELAPLGVRFIDAPLGGTPAQAEEGALSTMIGADDETFARVKPVAETWARKATHIGAVGDGHKMKLLNNFLSLGYASIYAEALALAQKVGITPQTFDSVLRGSRMDCGFYQTFFQYVLERDRDAHKFTLSNALKDLRYLGAMADGASVANPVGSAVKNAFAAAVAAGHAEDFVPMLSDFIARANGTSLA